MSQAFGLKKRGWFGSEALSANRAPAAVTEALLLTALNRFFEIELQTSSDMMGAAQLTK